MVGGLRYDWVDQEMTDEVAASTDQKDDSALSGQVGLLYLFDSGFAPYVSYCTSFVLSTQLSANGQVLDPTKGRQIAAGVKYQPEGRDFSLSTAIYRLVETEKPQYADWTGTSYIYENSGENTFTGSEVEGCAAFDNGLSQVAAYTYNHAEVAVNLDSSLIGNTATTTYRHVASLWVNYELGEGSALGGLSLGGGIRAASESVTSDENTSKNGSAIYQRHEPRQPPGPSLQRWLLLLWPGSNGPGFAQVYVVMVSRFKRIQQRIPLGKAASVVSRFPAQRGPHARVTGVSQR